MQRRLVCAYAHMSRRNMRMLRVKRAAAPSLHVIPADECCM
jgi:hypothetical protein